MKKWRKVITAALALTLLCGCQSQGKTENEPMEAMYIQKGEDFKIFVEVSSGNPFTATIPEGTEELTTGDIVEIYGNGIMLQSYPGQYPGVTKIVVKTQGEESDAEQYQSLLDEIYQEPDPSEPPFLDLEYRTEQARVCAVTNRGGVSWSYEDENGDMQSYISDTAFILDWKDLNDIRLSEPTDVSLLFSKEARKVTVTRYERTDSADEAESEGIEKDTLQKGGISEETSLPEDEAALKESESGMDDAISLGISVKEPKGELIEVSKEKGENGNAQYVLKGLKEEGVYLVRAEFEQGTVEYGFEVLPAKQAETKENASE